jgi:O-antigen ligase
VLLTVKDRFLFGDFGTYQLKNLHNGTLSIYSSLGIIGLVLFYVYFFRAYLYILVNGFKCRAAFIAFLGLLAIFVHSCTESAFMIGGSMYAGTYSILLILVKLDRKKVA